MASESRTAVVAALAGNLALVVLKATAAAITGSSAMFAETLHSLADTGDQALLLLGLRLAVRPPDARHPFGHGRNVFFWAFVVSGLLFGVGGVLSLWEAASAFRHPRQHEGFAWAYGVLAGALVFESASLSVALRSLLREKGTQAIRDYLRDARDPTILTVVCEDGAALMSIAIAAAGLALTQTTGSPAWDAVATVLIGTILIAVAVALAVDNYSLLIGETAPGDVETHIRTLAARDPAVETVAGLQTMHLGPISLLVALEIRFRPELHAGEVATAVERLEHAIRAGLRPTPGRHVVLIEPVARGADTRGAAA